MVSEILTLLQIAKTAFDLSDRVRDFGKGRIGRALASLPATLIDFGGEWLNEQRIMNLEQLRRRTEEILTARDSQQSHVEISPNILVPLAQAVSAESRDELQEMFARLLANAADPDRQNRVRREFIDLVSQMEPLDARLLLGISQAPTYSEFIDRVKAQFPDAPTGWETPADRIAFRILDYRNLMSDFTFDAIDLALDNLIHLRCIEIIEKGGRRSGNVLRHLIEHCDKETAGGPADFRDRVDTVRFTTRGRELLRALEL